MKLIPYDKDYHFEGRRSHEKKRIPNLRAVLQGLITVDFDGYIESSSGIDHLGLCLYRWLGCPTNILILFFDGTLNLYDYFPS